MKYFNYKDYLEIKMYAKLFAIKISFDINHLMHFDNY